MLPVRYTVILTDEVKARLHALPLALRREMATSFSCWRKTSAAT